MNRAKKGATQLGMKLLAVLTICCVCVQASGNWMTVLGGPIIRESFAKIASRLLRATLDLDKMTDALVRG